MAEQQDNKAQEETRSFFKELKEKISALNEGEANKGVESNQRQALSKMDILYGTISSQLTTLNKQVAKDNTLSDMLPYVIQISDNIYNIAGQMGAQVTSLKEVTKVLDAKKMGPQKDEGAELEKQREAAGKKDIKEKEKKAESFWDRIGKFFEFVLIPVLAGFAIGLSKALGGFESGLGKFITLFGVLYIAFSGFRKAVNSLVMNLAKKGLELIKGRPAAKAAGAAGAAADAAGKAPTVAGPDVKGPKGPSGLEKFLENAKKIGKSIKDLFVGIADTIAKVLSKLAGGIKDFISKVSEGIKNLLQNIAKGIESFGKGNVLKGAAALVVVAGALFVAGKAFQQFADVKWEAVAKGLVGITGLIVVMKLLEKATVSMIKGAAALTIMSGALFLAGKAFQQFAEVDWKTLGVAAVGIAGLAAALMILGPLLPGIALGAVSLTVMSAALAGFGAAVQVLAEGLPTIADFVERISALDGVGLLSAAAGITAVGIALAALGAGQVIQALGNFVSSILSFGKEDIFTKLTKLGEVAGDLNQLPSTIEALGKLSNFEVSKNFVNNIDILSAGLKKIAESAQGFEKTGDSLTALAKIAEVLNKPMGAGGASATEEKQPAGTAAPGKGKAPGKPGSEGQGQGTIEGFYPSDYKDEIEAEKAKLPSEMGNKDRIAAMKVRQKILDGKIKPKGSTKVTPAGDKPKGTMSGFHRGDYKDEITAKVAELRKTDPLATDEELRQEAEIEIKTELSEGKLEPKGTTVVTPYSQEQIQSQEQLAAKMEKSGNKTGAAQARTRVERMENLNKLAEDAAKLTPEQREAVVSGNKVEKETSVEKETLIAGEPVVPGRELSKNQLMAIDMGIASGNSYSPEIMAQFKKQKGLVKPVPTAPNGAAINNESQRVAGAQSEGKGMGASQNVVAPVTTTNVSQNQTQNISVKPSATPNFGITNSKPAFGF